MSTLEQIMGIISMLMLLFTRLSYGVGLPTCKQIETDLNTPTGSYISSLIQKILPTEGHTLIHFLNVRRCDLPSEMKHSSVVVSSPNTYNVSFTMKDYGFLQGGIPLPYKNSTKHNVPIGWHRTIHLYLFIASDKLNPIEAVFDKSDEQVWLWVVNQNQRIRYMLNSILQSSRVFDTYQNSSTPAYETSSSGYSRPFDISLVLMSKKSNNQIFWDFAFTMYLAQTRGFGAPAKKFAAYLNPNKHLEFVLLLHCDQCPEDSLERWKSVDYENVRDYLVKGYSNGKLMIHTVSISAKHIPNKSYDFSDNQEEYNTLQAILPQNTSIYLSNSHLTNPGVRTNVEFPTLFSTKTVSMEFFTCDGGYLKDRVSFTGYISAFDAPTWLLVICIVLLLSGICANESYKAVGKLSLKEAIYKYMFALVVVFRMLLFQGSEINNRRLKLPIQIWTICLFLIGYFYMGDNIGELTAPRQIVRYTSFKEIKLLNYTLWWDIKLLDVWATSDVNSNKKEIFCKSRDSFCNLLTLQRFDYLFNSLVYEMLKNKSWTVDLFMYISAAKLYDTDLFKSDFEETDKFLDGMCRKKAIIGWSDEVEEISNLIKLYKVFGMKSVRNAVLSQSNTGLLQHTKGWAFLNWGHSWILKRCTSIWNSGIYYHIRNQVEYNKQLKRMQKAQKYINEIAQPEMTVNEFTVSLNANTVVIFIVYLAGLLFGLLMLAYEVHAQLVQIVNKYYCRCYNLLSKALKILKTKVSALIRILKSK